MLSGKRREKKMSRNILDDGCALHQPPRSVWVRHSPPDTGGVAATSRRSREASLNGADGVVENGTSSKQRILKHSGNSNHPVCAAAEASHLFLDGAATPPISGGELPASHRKTPSRLSPLCVALLIVSILAACSSKTSPRADETRGQALYQFHCAPCHETPPPDLLKEPPKLKGLFNSKTLPSGAPATDEQVQMVIVEGLRTMPAFQGRLQEQEIRDLIAYLHKM
jgi:cytochrome c553